jgi:hypothetical protein
MSEDARIHRFTRDSALSVNKALPAAGAANASDAIDLGADNPGPIVDEFDVLVELPATPSLADTKTVTLTLEDSADGATFAAIPALATLVVTGAGGAGAAAATRRVKLPPDVRRYIRLGQAVASSGGDNTAVAATLSLVF